MAVDAAAQRLHRVVEVDAPEVFEPDDAVQLVERGVAGLGCAQVVARGEGVAGVDAGPHARLVAHPFDDAGEVFEAVAQVRTLSGGVLDDGRDPLRSFEGQVDRRSDAVEALLLRDLLQVAARMEVEPVEPQLLAARHLFDEGGARLLQPLAVGMPEVDEVGVVGQDLRRRVAQLVAGAAEGGDLGRGERLADPLALVLGEEGEARGSDRVCIAGRVLQAACRTHVCSEVFHGYAGFQQRYDFFRRRTSPRAESSPYAGGPRERPRGVRRPPGVRLTV